MRVISITTLILVSQLTFAQNTSFEPMQSSGITVAQTSPASASGEGSSEIYVPVNSNSPEESGLKAFGISFFSLGGIEANQFKRADPSFYVYDGYLSFNYKLNRNVRLAARPAFNYSTEGLDYQGRPATNKMTTRDFSILATRYNVFEDFIPAKYDIKAQIRMYLPTSEGSKAEGMISRLRFEFETKYFYDKYSNVRAYFKPSYFFQRSTAYLDIYGNTRTTNLADSQHGVELDMNMNKYFSAKPGFEIEDSWTNESIANDRDARHTTTIAYRFGVEVRPMREFNFTVGYQDRRDLVQMDRDKDISYSLMTNIRIY